MSTLRFIFFTGVLVAYNFLSIAQPQSVVPVGSPEKLTITDNNSLQVKSGKLFLDSKEGRNLFDKYITKSSNKTKKLNKRVEKTNRKYLKKYFKKAKKLHKKLCKVNPDLADYLFSYSNDPLYHHQNDVENSNYLKNRGAVKNYYPEYDSLKTSIAFLKDNKEVNETDSLKSESAWQMTEQLDSNLTNSSRLQQYFRERKSTFKASLKNYPELECNFKEIDKINYYYHEQISEYKNVLGDLSNVEEKALEILKSNSAYKKLLSEQGQLSVFSKAPPDWGKSIDGLQTIAQTKSSINEQINDLGPGAKSIIERNMEPMTASLKKLKSGEFGTISNAADIPSFKPSPLKTKRFIERLEFNNDFQINQSNNAFPSTINLGLQVGYKLSRKITPGIGGSYILGLGRRWDNISFTHQGMNIGSFVDYRVSSIFYFECRYEKNYLPPPPNTKLELGIKKWAWQDAALVGLKVKYSIRGKIAPTMSLLYDFYHDQHIPTTAAFVYRVGWSFSK